jgi:CHAT domain-containing protein/Flp pilus assembly protein TadD
MKYFVLALLTLSISNQLYAQEDLSKKSYAAIDSLILVSYKQRNYDQAILHSKVGLDKAEGEYGNVDTIFAKYLGNLGYFYKALGQFETASPFLLQAKKIIVQLQGKEHPNYSNIISNIASLYQVLGQFEKAEKLYLEAIQNRAKNIGKEHPDYARSLNNLGNLYQEIGIYEKAEAVYLQSQKIRAKVYGKDHPKYAIVLNNLAAVYHSMQMLERAEPLLLLSLSIKSKAYGEMHISNARTMTNLANVYNDMGRYTEAEKVLLQATNIEANFYGKEHSNYATNLSNLGSLYQKMGKYPQAKKLYLKAEEIYANTLGKENPNYAIILNKIATFYSKIKEYKKAEVLYHQAKNIQAKVLGKENISYATTLNNLASLYLSEGKLDLALSYSLQSMDANSGDLDSTFLLKDSKKWKKLIQADYYSNEVISNFTTTLLYITKAQYKKTKDPKDLNRHYELSQIAMQLNERIRNNLNGEKDKLRILKHNSDYIKHGIETAVLLDKESYFQEAFNFAEQNKSVLLADAVKGNRARALGDLPDSLIIQEIDLQKKIFKLKQKDLRERSNAEKQAQNQELSSLQVQMERFIASLKDKYPKYHALKYENITAKAADIQASLDDKTALVEYFLTDSICYLFWLSKTEIQVYPIAINAVKLKQSIHTFRSVLSNYNRVLKDEKKAYQSYIKIAHWFYQNLLEVALKGKDVENLIIVADGELGHLPFEAFLMTNVINRSILPYKDLHFLLKDYNVSYNYSATLWNENLTLSNKTNNGKILACASSYPPVDSALLELRLPYFFKLRSTLQELPAAQEEIKALSNNFEGTFLWNDATNEHFFKQNAADYAVIHLAMHGILDPNRPMLSSLVFTEDKDTLEDNFLQAYEISRLKLNADLVVLSACETGYGKFEQGEGVISLARSFMYAGVPSLVVSLWQVNDGSTAVIMKNFYENLAAGMNKAEALRQAKLSYLENTEGISAHPAFWSPFIQLGDSKPIYLATKGTWSYWLIGGGLLALVMGFFLWRRQRAL